MQWSVSGQFSAEPMMKTEWLGITVLTMLISDKNRLKGNIEQIDFHIALKTGKSLSWSNRLGQTVQLVFL